MKTVHPIAPVYNQESKALILGSFPSVKSRENGFFYGHPQNRFWKVISAICNWEVPESIEQKRELLLQNHIAIWDVIHSCEITGSSDSSIKDVVVNDISDMIAGSKVKKIYTNGKKAEELYKKYIYPFNHVETVCLPSTSPANAAWSLDRLIEAWSIIKTDLQ